LASVESLCREYERQVRLQWPHTLAGSQRVWFAVYEPALERRLLFRLPLFEEVTKKAGHGWKLVDLTRMFAEWMAGHEYREAYFADPDSLELALRDDFARYVSQSLQAQLEAPEVNDRTIVAVTGAASLFGLSRVSRVVEDVAHAIRGRLLVFFPGQVEANNYRLLDAGDGWNYLAVAITAKNGD